MDEPSRTTQARSIYNDRRGRGQTTNASTRRFGTTFCSISGKAIDESSDDSTPPSWSSSSSSLRANKILLQLNGDPCCSNGGANSTTATTTSGDGGGEGYMEDGTLTNHTSQPRLEECDAKRQIELIFRTPACWRSETDQTHLLYLLRQFPTLAGHNFDWDYNLFWKHGSEWSTPLCFLLASGANLPTIEAVYSMNPEAIWKPQGVRRDLPLHFACRFGVAENVLLFLIQKFPHAVVVSNSSGMLPIHCALGKKDIFPYGSFSHARLETIKILADLSPQSLLREEKDSQYTPLQIAFAHGYSFEVIDYIMSKLPERMEMFHLKAGCYHNKRFTVDFDRSEARLVSKLLPRLQTFHCEPSEWKMEGWVQLLACMPRSCSLVHFKAMNLPSDFLLEESATKAFSTLLRCNNSMESLGLSLQTEDKRIDPTDFFQCLDEGLRKNRCLQSLELDNFCVTCNTFNNFLACSSTPRVLTMTNLMLFEFPAEETKWNGPAKDNKLQKLVLSDYTLVEATAEEVDNKDDFFTLLRGLADFPRLRDLTLNSQKKMVLDATDPISVVLTSRSLESMKVWGLSAHMGPLCESLQFNLALSCFDFPSSLETKKSRGRLAETLENHNARIEFVQLPSPASKNQSEEDETIKIRYLTRLNHFGRGHLRDSNTSKSLLVTLLGEVVSQAKEFEPNEELSIHFGLLRECPSLWCNTAQCQGRDLTGRSRKRQRLV